MFLYGVSAVVLRRRPAGRAGADRAPTRRPPRNASRSASCPAPRAAVRLGEARHLVRRLRRAQRVERLHELRRALAALADERDAPAAECCLRRRRRRCTVTTSNACSNARASRAAPASPRSSTPPSARASACARPHDERAVGLRERQPVLEVRARAQRPVLVVEAAPLERRARLDDDGVPALLREHAREAALEVGDVVEVEAVEAHPASLECSERRARRPAICGRDGPSLSDVVTTTWLCSGREASCGGQLCGSH